MEARRLNPERLRAWGLSEAHNFKPPVITIAYLNEAGAESAVRHRFCPDKSPDGDGGFKWPKGSKVRRYGLDRLELVRERGYIVLVEGKSDCHTL